MDAKTLLEKFENFENFKSKISPAQLLVEYGNIRRFHDVYKCDRITLFTITEAFPIKNKIAGMMYLHDWFTHLNDFLNINKGIQPKQIAQLSFMMYSKYGELCLADLKLIFEYILESRYGTFYGSVDTQRLSTSFYEYYRERADAFKRLQYEEAEMLKSKEKEEIITDYQLSDIARKTIENLQKNYGLPWTIKQ